MAILITGVFIIYHVYYGTIFQLSLCYEKGVLLFFSLFPFLTFNRFLYCKNMYDVILALGDGQDRLVKAVEE